MHLHDFFSPVLEVPLFNHVKKTDYRFRICKPQMYGKFNYRK